MIKNHIDCIEEVCKVCGKKFYKRKDKKNPRCMQGATHFANIVRGFKCVTCSSKCSREWINTLRRNKIK